MSEETKTEDNPEEKAPKHKILRAVFRTGDDVNQNDFKTFLKSCPYSFEGGQTIEWARDEQGLFAGIAVTVAVDTNQDDFDDWLVTSGVDPWKIRSVPSEANEDGYHLAPEPPTPAEPAAEKEEGEKTA